MNMHFSKKDLGLVVVLGVIIGLVLGYAVNVQNIGNLESQISSFQSEVSSLESQIEQLRTLVPTLRSLADKHDILIGAAVSASLLIERDYTQTLSREFNILTTENALKFQPVHPIRNQYSFTDADAIVSFAEANNMKVRGHTLVWHNQLPGWINQGTFTREEWINILHDHITTVVSRYKGRIYAWDVVNEAVADDGSLRNTVWLQGIGPEYIDLAFQWAHEADPQALLFYNDYGASGLGGKSDAVYNLVRDLLERGVPIDGVGLQMHTSLEYPPVFSDIAANFKRLNDLGLEVQVTELDVRIREPATTADLTQQANIYRDMLDVCLSADNCTAFVMWGFTDRYSWIPGASPGYGSALIFDRSYNPKPAYYALIDVFIEHSNQD
jgi:endo-1,4-beta-xylanase